MSTHYLFEKSTNDKLFSGTQHGVVRLHHDHEIRNKFKSDDLVVIAYHGKKTVGIVRYEEGLSDFNKNSIYLTWDQRRDLALTGNQENLIALEITKGNFSDKLFYFFDSLFH